jgi:hypothetical protein
LNLSQLGHLSSHELATVASCEATDFGCRSYDSRLESVDQIPRRPFIMTYSD